MTTSDIQFDSFRVVEVDLIGPRMKDDVRLHLNSPRAEMYRSSSSFALGGGGNNGYNRQEQHSTETNFFKRPPAKNTLMDFMTTLKISRDSKLNHDEEKSKMKENFSETKRRAHEWTKSNNNGNFIQSDSNNNYSTDQPVETTDSSEGVTSESTEIHEQLDSEDDPSQAIYRERRNPLPPR